MEGEAERFDGIGEPLKRRVDQLTLDFFFVAMKILKSIDSN